jgi:hypothetical protein
MVFFSLHLKLANGKHGEKHVTILFVLLALKTLASHLTLCNHGSHPTRKGKC